MALLAFHLFAMSDTHTPVKHLPFALPDIGEEEIASVVKALQSGWLTTGPMTKRFEEEMAERIGPGVHALAVNSATSGLHLALEAAGIGPGDEVITTTYTFTATAEVVRYLGADPVFVDIEPTRMMIDPELVERAITPRTKAIMPVHLAGLAADMDAIIDIARRHNLRIIEDAAHAFPTTYKGVNIGALDTDASVVSFYATKTLPTGEGGMVFTRDEALAKRCRTMRLHGMDRDAFGRYTSNKPAWHYQIMAPGFKYNLPDLASALALPQLPRAEALRVRREEMARVYDEAFADLPVITPAHAPQGDKHSWHLYILRLADASEDQRNAFIEKLAAKGIGTSVHYIPLHLHPYWRDTYNLTPEMFPVAQEAYSKAVSLPIYTKMSDDDQHRVIDAVREVLRGGL
jgi:dTDP-4-amino-4,6-dideoxygalactose transaminase